MTTEVNEETDDFSRSHLSRSGERKRKSIVYRFSIGRGTGRRRLRRRRWRRRQFRIALRSISALQGKVQPSGNGESVIGTSVKCKISHIVKKSNILLSSLSLLLDYLSLATSFSLWIIRATRGSKEAPGSTFLLRLSQG